jgi:hypothetical protein
MGDVLAELGEYCGGGRSDARQRAATTSPGDGGGDLDQCDPGEE